MSIIKNIYPLDLTGVASSNLKLDIPFKLGFNIDRTVVLNEGAFFTDGLIVKDIDSLLTLTRGLDYECLYLYSDISKLAGGREVCGVILITNPKVSTNVSVTCQVVGGYMLSNHGAIMAAITDLTNDDRSFDWANIVNEPSAWSPVPHLHDLGDSFGYEFIISILVKINNIIIDNKLEISKRIMDHINLLTLQLSELILVHIHNTDNPHAVTADQALAYSRNELDELWQVIITEIGAATSRTSALITDLNSLITYATTLKEFSEYIIATPLAAGMAAHVANTTLLTELTDDLATTQQLVSSNTTKINTQMLPTDVATDTLLYSLKIQVADLNARSIELNNVINSIVVGAGVTKPPVNDKISAANTSIINYTNIINMRLAEYVELRRKIDELNLIIDGQLAWLDSESIKYTELLPKLDIELGKSQVLLQAILDYDGSAISKLHIRSSTGSSVSGLVPGKTYVVFAYGWGNDPGTNNMYTLGATSINADASYSAPSMYINAVDGSAPILRMEVVVAPASGTVSANLSGTVLMMVALGTTNSGSNSAPGGDTTYSANATVSKISNDWASTDVRVAPGKRYYYIPSDPKDSILAVYGGYAEPGNVIVPTRGIVYLGYPNAKVYAGSNNYGQANHYYYSYPAPGKLILLYAGRVGVATFTSVNSTTVMANNLMAGHTYQFGGGSEVELVSVSGSVSGVNLSAKTFVAGSGAIYAVAKITTTEWKPSSGSSGMSPVKTTTYQTSMQATMLN